MEKDLLSFLKGLPAKANVCIMLKTATVYTDDMEEALVTQDGCGNHHPKNWLHALGEHSFNILCCREESPNNWLLTIDLEKGDLSDRIRYKSNANAVYELFNDEEDDDNK